MSSVPRFSVIVPTHNRPALLRNCLASLHQQELTQDDFEIMVVDDGSRRRSYRAVAPLVAANRIRYLRRSQGGWGAARLAGALECRGEILVFLDDDCQAPPDWLRTIARIYDTMPEVDGVAGGLRPGPVMNLAGRKQHLGHLAYFDRLNRPLGITSSQAGRAWFTFGGNRSFRRDIWLAAQPEAPRWYFDDTWIDLRLRRVDAMVYYEPAAWVSHHYAPDLGQRWRAAFRYGRSERYMPAGLQASDSLATSLSLGARWHRLGREIEDEPLSSVISYLATQPLVWLARWLGQRRFVS